MEDFKEILGRVYFSNSVQDYLILLGLILLGIIFQRFLAKIFSNLLFSVVKKYAEGVSNEQFFRLLQKPLSFFILLVIIYTATDHIEYPESWNLDPVDEFGIKMVLHRSYLLVMIGSITWVFTQIIEFMGLILLEKAKKTDSKTDDQLIPFGIEMIKIIIVVFAVFFAMGSVFKVNVASLIAGLGVGGLALALAAKESLENLLGSFTIFFDKPFVVGDYVKVGNIAGTVEKIGFRSTRIRTLEKSYLTVPNKKMIDAELDNMTLRTFRRAKFNIGVVYGTTKDQITNIVKEIKQFIDEHPHTNQDGQVKFTEFGNSSLNIMVLFYVDTMDWGVFLDVQEEINFKIMEIVAKNKSDFAFPTQTIHLENNS